MPFNSFTAKPETNEHIGRGSRLLRFYSYYSLLLALTLIVIDGIDSKDIILGGKVPQMFLVLSSVYVFSAAIFAAIISRTSDSQAATAYLFVETALLTGLMYSSGGLEAGFSSLLLIPIIIANLLAPGILGYSVAAWVSIAVIYTQHIVPQDFGISDSANTGVYGAICFAIAGLTQLLSRRIKDALSLASYNAKNIRRLQRLSQHALMNLPDGIIACNHDQSVLFFNDTALQWFSLKRGGLLPAELINVHANTRLTLNGTSLSVRYITISDTDDDFLLLLEDDARISAEAQQIKLASLGRLTASIAHEIRNPLSSLNQAAQLLSEAPHLTDQDRELTSIIENNSQRINRTIRDILQLSSGRKATLSSLPLSAFLHEFIVLFKQLDSLSDYEFIINCPNDLQVQFDADHLNQVLTNLCVNGLRYARKARIHPPKLTIDVLPAGRNRVEIDVIDNGLGVADNQRDRLFEPFSTTEHNGTGLGLYLCRELCQANQASIEYIPHDTGACFRLTLKM